MYVFYFLHLKIYFSEGAQTSHRTLKGVHSIKSSQFLCKRIFSRAVLEMQRSGGLHEMGYPKWQLVLCLIVVYSMLYLSLFKGVKSSGT